MTALSQRFIVLGLMVLLAFAAPTQTYAQAAPQPHPAPPRAEADAIPDAARSDSRVPASESEAASTKPPEGAETGSQVAAEDLAPYNPLDTYSFYLTALFILFGLGVILLQLAAMRRIKDVTADEIARNCAITLVVVASVALLVSGYSSQQVAPAFGLFGTIIGYLLGKAGAKENAGAAKPGSTPPTPPAS